MSLLDNAISLFKPKSPLATKTPADMMSTGAAADYRLDLALQNLLAIGAEFSPDDIINLRKRARYGDPRWLYSLYDEMMRLGPAPQVLKAREAIKGTQTIWKATPAEADEDENSNDPEDKAARLIRDVTEEAWGAWLPDLKTHLSTKYFYGIAAVQVMWKPKAIENKWSRITDIRPIPARRFRLDPQTLRFKFLPNPFSFEGPFVDDLQKTGKMIFVEVGGDTEPLDQRGLLFQCLIPWAIEQFTVRWRAKRLQNFGMPPVMVSYPKGDPNNKAVADQLADMLANGTRASLPDGLSATLLSAPGSGSRGGDPYESNIEWCERAYDKIILGHSQVSGVQVGAGSKTSSNDAIGLFKDVTNSRAKELDTDLQQQCFHPFVEREFGTEWAENHTPTTTSAILERDNPQEIAQVALTFFQAGAAGVIAVEDLVERASLKIAEDGELTLAGNVKGAHPAPAEVDAINKANPPAAPPQAEVGPDGQPTGKMLPGAPVRKFVPGGKDKPGAQAVEPPAGKQPPAFGKPAAAGKPAEKAAPEKKKFMTVADFAPAAAAALRKRKGKRAVVEFYTRRQRFAAASLVGGKPRVVLAEFGDEAPAESAMTFAVDALTRAEGRDAIEAHPMTGAIYRDVRERVQRAITAGTITGEVDMTFGIGSKYVAERLAEDLRREGFVVAVEREQPKLGPLGLVEEEFGSDDQPRDEKGRWSTAGGDAGKASSRDEHARASAYHREAAARLAGEALRHPAAHLAEHPKTQTDYAYAIRRHDEAAAAHDHATRDQRGARVSSDARHATTAAHIAEDRLAKHTGGERRVQPPTWSDLATAGQSMQLVTGAKPGSMFTAIDLVEPERFSPAPRVQKPERLREMQAKVAARVRNRLKEQHAVALAEAEARVAK